MGIRHYPSSIDNRMADQKKKRIVRDYHPLKIFLRHHPVHDPDHNSGVKNRDQAGR